MIQKLKWYKYVFNSGVLLLCLCMAPFSHADESLFRNHCGACHTLSAEEAPRQGPHLANLMGRKAGSVEGFPYSSDLAGLDVQWSAENLDKWLASPQSMAANSYMIYQQKDAGIRQSIIKFLETQ